MKSIIIAVLVIFSSVLCVNTSFSQVVQKQANKWQLINGVKLKPGTKIKSFIKTKETSATNPIKSQDVNESPNLFFHDELSLKCLCEKNIQRAEELHIGHN